MHVIVLAFTPSLYIPLQAITSTPIYTMEISSSSWKIEKFSGRPSVEGQVSFLWGSSRQLFQLWFVNLSSSMVLITPRCLHSNNWPVMCTMRHWMSTSNILQGFWASLKFPILLMPEPSSLPYKLHNKLPLHIMGLCPIIQIRYSLQKTFFLNNSLLLPQTFLPPLMC